MPVVIDDVRIRISGEDFEPRDPLWAFAPPAERIAHWKLVGELAIRRIRNRLRLGRDRHGKKLAPIRYTRPDGATGPPLTPHRAESRFQRYLRAFAATDRATVFWGQGWAKVVRGHKVGWGALPVRDVVGLTRADERYVRDEARAVWDRRHGRRVLAPAPAPAPAPAVPRATPAPRPARGRPGEVPAAARELARRYPQLEPFLRTPR